MKKTQIENNLPKAIKINNQYINPWNTWFEPNLWEALSFFMQSDKSNIPNDEVCHFKSSTRLRFKNEKCS